MTSKNFILNSAPNAEPPTNSQEGRPVAPASATAARFGEPWPADQLELVLHCPFCGSPAHSTAHQGVKDWSFQSAPGEWAYQECSDCLGLYLSPRPRAEYIGDAYASYYTHSTEAKPGWRAAFTLRLRHELWAQYSGLPVGPRLHAPKWLARGLSAIAPRLKTMSDPGYVLSQLAVLPKGKLLDVGCGNGRYLAYAQQLGWQAQGIEIDPSAVQAAQARGLQVDQAGFDQLNDLPCDFACVLASHTLEHTHRPLQALRDLLARLRPGGSLVLALPNAASPVRAAYGKYWRGLEAPRHIAIPTHTFLVNALEQLGCKVVLRSTTTCYTESESENIRSLFGAAHAVSERPTKRRMQVDINPANANPGAPDLIELCATPITPIRQ